MPNYESLDHTRPGVLEVLLSWKEALESTRDYLSQLEETLRAPEKLEFLIAELFQLPMKANRVASMKLVLKPHITFGAAIGFDFRPVSVELIENLRGVASTLTSLFDVPDSQELYWDVITTALVVSSDRRSVDKIGRTNQNNSQAIASSGWEDGIHTWTLLVNGSLGVSTTRQLHWIVIGVAVESFKYDPFKSYDGKGQTFGHSTRGEEYFNMGKLSGSCTKVAPGTEVTLTLDCDEGTLSYSQNGLEYLKIKVPQHTTLYPWVHLKAQKNSVTFV